MREYKKLLPKTEEYLEYMEKLYDRFTADYDQLEKERIEQTEDYLIFRDPMCKLAQILYGEYDFWAVSLAKYIAVMNGDCYIPSMKHMKE